VTRAERDALNPPHYRYAVEVADAIEAWGLNWHTGSAVKYLARAGRKPGNSEAQDLRKAIWYLERRLKWLAK
jgi:hypothetical protein